MIDLLILWRLGSIQRDLRGYDEGSGLLAALVIPLILTLWPLFLYRWLRRGKNQTRYAAWSLSFGIGVILFFVSPVAYAVAGFITLCCCVYVAAEL